MLIVTHQTLGKRVVTSYIEDLGKYWITLNAVEALLRLTLCFTIFCSYKNKNNNEDTEYKGFWFFPAPVKMTDQPYDRHSDNIPMDKRMTLMPRVPICNLLCLLLYHCCCYYYPSSSSYCCCIIPDVIINVTLSSSSLLLLY